MHQLPWDVKFRQPCTKPSQHGDHQNTQDCTCRPNELSFTVCEYCAKLPATQNMRLVFNISFCFLHESKYNNDKIIIAKCSRKQNLTLRQTIKLFPSLLVT